MPAAGSPLNSARSVPPIRRFYFHHSFPVDARHNAKIFRDRLAIWAATQEAIEVDGLVRHLPGET